MTETIAERDHLTPFLLSCPAAPVFDGLPSMVLMGAVAGEGAAPLLVGVLGGDERAFGMRRMCSSIATSIVTALRLGMCN
jgi:hypothetical protein